MALIHRISRLFTADLHAVLDRLEEPEALLKQAVREMEELLAQSEQRVRVLEVERVEMTRRLDAVARSVAGVDGELDLCLDRSEDTLARSLVRRKLEGERATRMIEVRIIEVERQLDEHNALVEEQRRELDAVRQKAELFVAPTRDGTVPNVGDSAISSDDIEVALLREKAQRERTRQEKSGRTHA